jgi:rhodanese-related sulfurtransferase
MNLISRDELKARLERKDNFKLVMALGEWAYRAKHIPGSLYFSTPDEALAALGRDDDIVVYCASSDCLASAVAYRFLEGRGYTHIQRYAGGVLDWEEAGYPLEGEMVG